ncbi:DUF6574 domain-containing protein [Rossellomorea sp. KS-H15a]|uniref:DUF6574 domain-containing protein n=1 Tax=Rossellomorea sp. KS-H15a TaxID=2963940 RepID=UPI0020C65D39|nr:DUF6574 domain-containing protein [Rossellomorea sp. KS-H15a]UTE77442.1 hypothetical protein M1J35_01080 [Rossellomorea sp. KS-H15a]
MMKCSKCFNEQDSGKFCGKCGANLMEAEITHQPTAYEEVAAASETVAREQVPVNESVTKAKEGVSKYWNYALQILKKPSLALEGGDHQFKNGLITIGLFVIAFSLSIYFLVNKLFKAMFGGLGSMFSEDGMGAQSLPFFHITSSLFMFSLIFLVGALISVFLAGKFMSKGITFKKLLAQFGGVLVPFATLNVVAIPTGLMGSVQWTLILTGVSLFYAIVIMPAIVVYDRAMKSQQSVNKVYLAAGASALSMFITYLVIRTSVMEFMEEIESLVNMGF